MNNKTTKNIFYDLVNTKYLNYTKCFTDGSKTDEAVGAAVYVEDFNFTLTWRLSNGHSVIFAELFAIYYCLSWLLNNSSNNFIVICSDSLTAIKMISGCLLKSYRTIVTNIQKILMEFYSKSVTIVIQWIPSHTGIHGNELVDALAKNACNYNEITYSEFEFEEYISIAKRSLKNHNLNSWNNIKNHIHFGKIVQDINKWKWITSGNRHCDVLMARLRNGVAGVNSYLFRLNLVDSPNCIYCVGIEETIQHYILDCPRHVIERNNLFFKLTEIGLSVNNLSIPILLSGTDFSPNKFRRVMFAMYNYFQDTGKLNIL